MSPVVVAIVAAGFTSLGVLTALVIHIIKYGEEKGAMRERIKRLEQEMIEQKDTKEVVAELKMSVGMLRQTMDQFQDYMTHLFSQPIPPTGRK